jgi:hypothetical protein
LQEFTQLAGDAWLVGERKPEQLGGKGAIQRAERGISGQRPEVCLDRDDIAPGERACKRLAEFERGYVLGRGEEERGQGFPAEVIWQTREGPEAAAGTGECDHVVADEDGGGMVEGAIDPFETERLRAEHRDHSLQECGKGIAGLDPAEDAAKALRLG